VTDDAEREQGENEETAERPESGAEEQRPEQPAAGESEQPAAEQPEAGVPGALEDAPAEEPAGDAAAEEPAGDAAAEEPAERPRKPAGEGAKAKKDVVPGADLEPIARAAREAEEEERRAREAAAAADDEDEEAIAARPISVPSDTRIQATGKRKSSVARVVVRAGDGSFLINDRGIEEYFRSSQHQAQARQPLVTTGYDGIVDVKVRVHGGGVSGQAGAVRHGVARALTELEPELRGELKRRGMLTRDDRRKERKKAGLKKARKRPQFSKR